MERKVISKSTAERLIRNSGGRIGYARFKKKTTGDIRNMRFRIQVSKGVSGKGLKYNPADKEVIPVYDMQGRDFRMINAPGLEYLAVDGEKYDVK